MDSKHGHRKQVVTPKAASLLVRFCICLVAALIVDLDPLWSWWLAWGLLFFDRSHSWEKVDFLRLLGRRWSFRTRWAGGRSELDLLAFGESKNMSRFLAHWSHFDSHFILIIIISRSAFIGHAWVTLYRPGTRNSAGLVPAAIELMPHGYAPYLCN